MSILDTFYILFKSNAAELIKGNEKAGESVDKLEKKLTEQEKAVKRLGEGFTSMVEGFASAVTTGAIFSAFKTGIMDAQQFNTELFKQSRLLGRNASDLSAYAGAVAAAGGDAQAFQGTLKSLYEQYAMMGFGGQMPDFLARLRDLAYKFEGMSKSQSFMIGKKLGLDNGTIMLLQQGGKEFDRLIEKQRELGKVTQEDTLIAQQFAIEQNNLGVSFRSLFTSIGSDVLPALGWLYRRLEDVAVWMRENKSFVYGFFGGLTLIIGGLAVAALAAAAPFLALAGIIAAAAVSIGLIVKGITDIVTGIGRMTGLIKEAKGEKPSQETASSTSSKTGNKSMDFWMQNGLTRAQAAGMVANEMAESGGNPAAVGDGGRARGLFQWHPDRQRNILAGTGIDVTSASHADQLRAALWELNNTESAAGDRLRAAVTPEEAGGAVSMYYERPADRYGEARKRAMMARQAYNAWTMDDVSNGQQAISFAGSSQIASQPNNAFSQNTSQKSTSIRIDQINVQTQATDADGIAAGINKGLRDHFRLTVGNLDDGVAM